MVARKRTTMAQVKAELSAPVKTRAMPAKDLQAQKLKAIDAKIEELQKMIKSYEERGYTNTTYTVEYKKLMKRRKHIEEWQL